MRKSSFSIVHDEDSDGSNRSSEDELLSLDKKSTKQFKYLDKLEGVKIDDDSDEESKKVVPRSAMEFQYIHRFF